MAYEPLATTERRRRCAWPSEPTPRLPPTELPLDLLFFRHLFELLKRKGHAKDGEVQFTVLRAVAIRLLDVLGLNGLNYFGAAFPGCDGKDVVTWVHLRDGLLGHGFPEVKLSTAERIYLTLEDLSSCTLAKVMAVLSAVVIFTNLALIVLQTLPEQCVAIFAVESPHNRCGKGLETACILFFSLEYTIKLVCAPWVRVEILDRDLLLQVVVPTSTRPQDFASGVERNPLMRIWNVVVKSMNLVDLVSILPFWLNLVFGEFLEMLPPSSTSFLRTLRVLRMFRILKTARFSSTLQVLGRTLLRSIQAMLVVVLYILITSLIAGMVLQQAEKQADAENFGTVPRSSWWVFVRLISMQHSADFAAGRPSSVLGSLVLSAIMCYKGILWILPFGQIGSVFREEWANVETALALKEQLDQEMEEKQGLGWFSISNSATAHLEFWIKDGDSSVELTALAQQESGEADKEARSVAPMRTDSKPQGAVSIPVPILMSTGVEAEVDHPITVGNLRPWYSSPASIRVRVKWDPEEAMKATNHPQGQLEVEVLQARGFPDVGGQRWCCRLSVPAVLHGERLHTVCVREKVSVRGGSNPSWSGPLRYTVDWTNAVSRSNEDDDAPEEKETSVDARVLSRRVSTVSTTSMIDQMETEDLQRHIAKGLDHANRTLTKHSRVLDTLNRRLNQIEMVVPRVSDTLRAEL